MFQVVSARETDDKIADSAEPLFKYELRQTKIIRGRLQSNISLVGLRPYKKAPQHYFGLLAIHAQVTADRPATLGTTTIAMRQDSSSGTHILFSGGQTAKSTMS